MTQEEFQNLLKTLDIEEGKKKTAKEGSYTANFPKHKELTETLTQMKRIFQQQLSQEEAELAHLNEELVRAKKGGCNG